MLIDVYFISTNIFSLHLMDLYKFAKKLIELLLNIFFYIQVLII